MISDVEILEWIQCVNIDISARHVTLLTVLLPLTSPNHVFRPARKNVMRLQGWYLFIVPLSWSLVWHLANPFEGLEVHLRISTPNAHQGVLKLCVPVDLFLLLLFIVMAV